MASSVPGTRVGFPERDLIRLSFEKAAKSRVPSQVPSSATACRILS